MMKHTGIVASAALKRRIPPARAMPVITTRRRNPGWVPAKTVGSFVPGLTRQAFETFGFSTATLITDWVQIVGDGVAAYTAPQRLKWPRLKGGGEEGEAEAGGRPGATLVLKVDPARALEAEYGARQMIERINAYFGYRAVAQIRLVQAPLHYTIPPGCPPLPKAGKANEAAAARRPSDQSDATGTTGSPNPGSRLDAALARLGASVAAEQRRS